MRDVINLAWKLPLVLEGLAGDQLLDTYYGERNAHASDLVDWAVAIGRLMEHLAEVERCQREGLPPPLERAQLKSSGYGQGREQPPIREGAVLLNQVSDDGSTGYLLSQPIVENAAGERFRFDDMLGPGIAIITRNAESEKLSKNSRLVVERLNINFVSTFGLKAVQGHFDRLFEKNEAAIIRPDRIVFGHTTKNLSLDELIGLLAKSLCLNL